MFSDEKKFNLDGPDGFAYYWHDLRREQLIFSKRQQGGRSLIVWGAMSYYVLSDLIVIKWNQDSKGYCDTLETGLLEFAATTLGETFTFQQDNAVIHTSRYTRKWLADRNLDVMQWPAKSSDLNIIANFWGILSRAVYKNDRPFEHLEDLMEVVEEEWANIRVDYLKKLYKSIPKRLMQVIGEGRQEDEVLSKVLYLPLFVDFCGLITVLRPMFYFITFLFRQMADLYLL